MVKIDTSKAMSNVIATLLIVLLGIILVIIVWIIVSDLVAKDTELSEIKTEFFSEDIQIVAFTSYEEGVFSVSLKRVARREKKAVHLLEEGEFGNYPKLDVVSVVDLSGSMVSCNGINSHNCNSLGGSFSSPNCYGISEDSEEDCIDFGGTWVNRLTPTKEANRQLLSLLGDLENSRVGVVAYNNRVVRSSVMDLTSNIGSLNSAINSWGTGGNTCICCGINEALRILERQSSDDTLKKIIVMSDGEANTVCSEQGTGSAMRDAILASCNAYSVLPNLTIYSIGAGEDVNENTLREIASCGGGTYYPAPDMADLIGTYNDIIRQIRRDYASSYSRLDYLYIVFYNETSRHIEKITDIPENLVVRSYTFNLAGKIEGEIIKVEIYPVILLKSGKEEIGPLYHSWVKK